MLQFALDDNADVCDIMAHKSNWVDDPPLDLERCQEVKSGISARQGSREFGPPRRNIHFVQRQWTLEEQ